MSRRNVVHCDICACSWASQPCRVSYIEDVSQGTSATTYDIDQKPFYLIGRDSSLSNDVLVDDASVSRRHAAIVHHEDGRIFIIDLASVRSGSFGIVFENKIYYFCQSERDFDDDEI